MKPETKIAPVIITVDGEKFIEKNVPTRTSQKSLVEKERLLSEERDSQVALMTEAMEKYQSSITRYDEQLAEIRAELDLFK